jgi:tRNA wybutosine-synthesizing protein 3
MAATLQHAQPVLAAASSAGFRESGLQSLRCLASLDDAGDATSLPPSSFPMVAVRSSGLALESIIGCSSDDDQPSRSSEGVPVTGANSLVQSLVTEEYLAMLVSIANERFIVNKARVSRFRTHLLISLNSLPTSSNDHISHHNYNRTGTTLSLAVAGTPPSVNAQSSSLSPLQEDPIKRRERKRAEGLLKQRTQQLLLKPECSQIPAHQHDEPEDEIGSASEVEGLNCLF